MKRKGGVGVFTQQWRALMGLHCPKGSMGRPQRRGGQTVVEPGQHGVKTFPLPQLKHSREQVGRFTFV